MDCRFCKNYDPTGRNGGYCNLLTVPVQGKWDACRCFSSSFPENSLLELEKLTPNLRLHIDAIAT